MRRVLVTGATGFLGRALVPRLADAGWTVTAHGRQPPAVTGATDELRGDLADSVTTLAPWRWDAVVNLAGPVTGGAEPWQEGVDVVHAHLRISLGLRRCAPASTRIVHASSMTVYGDVATGVVREDHPRRPRHLYGLAKSVAEEVWLAEPALDAWVLRLPGLFSEHRRSGALYHFCRAARRGEAVRVTATTPTPWHVLHVDDAADALVRALAATERGGGAINVAYRSPVEIVAIATWIAEHAARGSAVEHANVAHPVLELDTTRARALLGWDPPSLHDRLARLYAAYAEGEA